MLTDHYLSQAITQLQDKVDSNWSHLAIGTDATAETSGDTSLYSEVLRKAREELTDSGDSTTVSLWIASTEANGNILKEVGAFDDPSIGNMKDRETFSSISKIDSMEVWIDIELNFSVSEVNI